MKTAPKQMMDKETAHKIWMEICDHPHLTIFFNEDGNKSDDNTIEALIMKIANNKPMTNTEKLEKAVALLQEVEIDNDNVINYPITLPSFDALVADLGAIELEKGR